MHHIYLAMVINELVFLVIKELNKYRYYFNDNALATEILNLAIHTVSEQEFKTRVCNCII